MSDKFIFKILERQNDILLIIENDNLKFMTELDENVFKLPYLKNKDLAKFLGKVLDRFSDNILKLNYYIFSKKSTRFFSSAHGGGVVDPLPTEKYVYKEYCRNIFHSRCCV